MKIGPSISSNKELNSIKRNVELFQFMGFEPNVQNINCIKHASYSINLLNDKSVNKLIEEVNNTIAQTIVFHVPKNTTHQTDAKNVFIQNLIKVLNAISSSKILLLESGAGQGSEMFLTFSELLEICKSVKKFKNFGLCIDTCHIFNAGITMDEFVQFLQKHHKLVKLIHLNDSATPFNSRVDRHAPLGTGYIFKNDLNMLQTIVSLCRKFDIDIILETSLDSFFNEVTLLQKEFKHHNHVKFSDKIYYEINEKIVKILTALANNTDNDFRRRAFLNAASVVENLEFELTNSEQLKHIKGIGKGVLERIDEILQTGTLQEYEVEKEKIKAINNLTQIDGIGYKTALKLYEEYNITSIKQLKNKIKEDIPILTKRIKKGLTYYLDLKEMIPREDIIWFESQLKDIFYGEFKFEIAGSYRRGAKESGDIDVLFRNVLISSIVDKLENWFELDVISMGLTKATVIIKILDKYRQVDILSVPSDEFYTALLYFTGSKTFNIQMREFANSIGYKLNEHGLYKGSKKVKVNSEKEVFNILGLKYLEPNNR